MWNKNNLKEFQVLGANLHSIMQGFGTFTLIASKMLLDEGMGTPDANMMVQFKRTEWYPLDRFLRAFDRIHAEFGDFTLRQVGLHIPKNSVFPPNVIDVHSAFQTLDAGYHINHGYQNRPMFDVVTGQMTEGIGHYRYKSTGPTSLVCEADNPYPCAFDQGLVTATAQLFKPSATVVHDKVSCRSRGGNSCTYHVSWK